MLESKKKEEEKPCKCEITFLLVLNLRSIFAVWAAWLPPLILMVAPARRGQLFCRRQRRAPTTVTPGKYTSRERGKSHQRRNKSNMSSPKSKYSNIEINLIQSRLHTNTDDPGTSLRTDLWPTILPPLRMDARNAWKLASNIVLMLKKNSSSTSISRLCLFVCTCYDPQDVFHDPLKGWLILTKAHRWGFDSLVLGATFCFDSA